MRAKKGIGLAAVLCFLLLLLFVIRPLPHGWVVYQPVSYNWTFETADNTTYDPERIQLSGGEASLLPQVTITVWNRTEDTFVSLSEAWYNPDDKTAKVQTLQDGKEQAFRPDKRLDLVFAEPVGDGDALTMVLTSGNATGAYLCDASSSCDPPGYGGGEDTNGTGESLFALSGLPSPPRAFSLPLA